MCGIHLQQAAAHMDWVLTKPSLSMVPTFTVTPGGGSYGAPYNQDPNYIESGEAFLVGGNASAYTITFKEDIKPSVNNLVSFLPMGTHNL